MSDECDHDSMTKRADSTYKCVVDYDGGREGTGMMGNTRVAGIVATGRQNPREREQAVFRGKENIRRGNSR